MAIFNGKKHLLSKTAPIMAAILLSGCNLMHDDLDDCALPPEVKTSVDFVYDYNVQSADLFGSHVGAVTLYVFDNDGKFIMQEEKTLLGTSGALAQPGFKMDLELDPGAYRVYALAQGHHKGYESSLEQTGARFRRVNLLPGDDVEKLLVSLDHEAGTVNHQGQRLDTLWVSRQGQILEVPEVKLPKEGEPQQPDIDVKATLSLMRVTNDLHISFYQKDMPHAINHEDYEVWISTPSGRDVLGVTGNVHTSAVPLRYNPYRISTVNADSKASVATEFSISRMFYDRAHRSTLNIRNKITGYVNSIDIPDILCRGNREVYSSHGWTEQEFLDRNYDYTLELELEDGVWKFITVRIEALSWAKRIQNVNL